MALLVVAMIPAFLGEAKATLGLLLSIGGLRSGGAGILSSWAPAWSVLRRFGSSDWTAPCDRQVATARKIYEENRALAIKKTTSIPH